MIKKFLILLCVILIIVSIVFIFQADILWFVYEKKYDNKYKNTYSVEKNLSYNKESNLIEENLVSINDFNIVLSDFEYTENELNFNLKFSHLKPLLHVGYILKIYNKEYFLEEMVTGKSSFDSAIDFIISETKFHERNFKSNFKTKKNLYEAPYSNENYNLTFITESKQQNELLEDGTLLHKISIKIPEEFVTEDTINILLTDINYQNISDKNYYQVIKPMSEIKYIIK